MRLLFILFAMALFACNSTQKMASTKVPEQVVLNESFPAPKLYIYKTKKDYYNLVPIALSADKTTIISFPHPTDVEVEGKLTYPIKLPEGYYLDVKGIDVNVAFLKITYADYRKLPSAPTIEQLFELIEDADPLLELWDCGIKTNEPNEIDKVAQWVISGKIVDYGKRIK